MRTGVLNVTVDTEAQRQAFLHANFGVDINDEEPVNLDMVDDIQIENVLKKAREEVRTFTPPMSTLQCTYRHVKRPSVGTRVVLRIRLVKYL